MMRSNKKLTRDQIIDWAIRLLDESGPSGLTYTRLAKELHTGAGAIYWHIKNKDELLALAANRVIESALSVSHSSVTPRAAVHDFAARLFDVATRNAWINPLLENFFESQIAGQLYEHLGELMNAFGTANENHQIVTSAIFYYIIGTSKHVAAYKGLTVMTSPPLKENNLELFEKQIRNDERLVLFKGIELIISIYGL